MKAKTIITIVASVLIVAGVGFLITWGALNFSKISQGMSGTGLYTQDDINNAYKDGFDTALVNEAEYDLLIENYENTIANLNLLVANLTTGNAEQLAEINTLQGQANILQNFINSMNKYIVHFYVGDIVHEILFVDPTISGFNFTPSTPSKAGHSFAGWSLDGVNTVGLVSTNITSNANFYAVFSPVAPVNVSFVVDGSTIRNYSAQVGTTATAPANPTKLRNQFVGWSTNGTMGGLVANIDNYTVLGNTTFTAMWRSVQDWSRVWTYQGTDARGQHINYFNEWDIVGFVGGDYPLIDAIRITFAYQFTATTADWNIGTIELRGGEKARFITEDKGSASSMSFDTLLYFHLDYYGYINITSADFHYPNGFYVRSIDYFY